MIDLEHLESDFEKIQIALKGKNVNIKQLEKLVDLNKKRKKDLNISQEIRNNNNKISKEVAHLVQEKKLDKVQSLRSYVNKNKEQLVELEKRISNFENEIEKILLEVPNIPDQSVPEGVDETGNVFIRSFGKANKNSKAHWDIAKELNIIDFETATLMSGPRFAIYRGDGAKLMRALINFMLDQHIKNGYQEIMPPVIVNEKSLIVSGNLPKFETDLFKVDEKRYLIPTAEAPLTNLFRDKILSVNDLPAKYCAYTQCFRQEAGAHGSDTRGIIRTHQFNKVELYIFSKPEQSMELLEKLTNNAESILVLLGLPYKVIQLCNGDLGFSSAKTYDIEVWMPSQNKYREISSCSNCTDFQARRGKIRYKDDINGKTKLVHTLNGSGLAVDRLFAAILENCYSEVEKGVVIPTVLVKYMNGQTKIVNKNVSRETSL